MVPRGNLAWLKDRTIFLTKHGSHAYGTNTPESDIDVKGIAIPPRKYFLGFLERFEQADKGNAIDAVIYNVQKFFDLAADCNPNIIEVLFTDQSDWLVTDRQRWEWDGYGFERSPWGRIYAARNEFLSQNAKYRFSGYAFGQLKRIKTHRAWLLNPPKKQPSRTDFGLPKDEPTIGKEQLGVIEARVRKLSDKLAGEGWTRDRIDENAEAIVTQVASEVNLASEVIPIIIAERKYHAAMKHWHGYLKWDRERNDKRRELEAKYGYDTKHAMHLVRLMRMAEEIMRRGEAIVRRPDADELNAVRHGQWKFDDLLQWAQDKEKAILAIKGSPLPYEPDRAALDALLVDIVSDYLACNG